MLTAAACGALIILAPAAGASARQTQAPGLSETRALCRVYEALPTLPEPGALARAELAPLRIAQQRVGALDVVFAGVFTG